MINTNEFYFTSADGASRVYVKEWLPQEEPSAILLISHGLGEHINRYSEFAAFMAEYGVLVAGADHPGHGKTASGAEDLGFFAEENGWKLLVDNLHILQQMEQDAHIGVPIFLLGHDMGARVVQNYMMDYCDELNGAILSAAGELKERQLRAALAVAAAEELQFGPRHRSVTLDRLFACTYNKRFAPTRTKFDWLTRDEAMVDSYCADPACGFLTTVSAYRDVLKGTLEVQNHRNLTQIMPNLPVFMFAGEMDPMGDRGRGMQKLAHALQDAGVRRLTVKLYADGRHNMLHERSREQVYSDILTWIGNRV